MHLPHEFIEVMAKHLPPSAADLRLLDVGGVARDVFLTLRGDLQIEVASLDVAHWHYAPASADAIVAFDLLPSATFLKNALATLRPGGRLIIVNPFGEVTRALVQQLESSGYVRILVEPALDDEQGVLMRGEKAHTTTDTLKRVGDVAKRDADLLDLDDFRGRYVHLLVRQTPNKPVWKLTPDEVIVWHAAAIQRDEATTLLGFSSLPKAVSFMQPAVVEGIVTDVNKVGKFSKETARMWTQPVLLNPTLDVVREDVITWLKVDPDTAEAPDE